VTKTTVGRPGLPRRRRSSANASAAGGYTRSGRQVPFGEASIVPEPTSTASAHARSRPIRKRSASLSAAISAFDPGSSGIATTPSIVCTKLAKTDGSSNPSPPP
jgi:hypothetical protein